MKLFFITLIQIVLVPAVSPLLVGIVRKVKARLQNRRGASIVQPYWDLAKLFHKDEIISRDASWLFRIAPYIVFGVTLVLAAGLPSMLAVSGVPVLSDFILFVYAVALGTFFLALAGMDTGSGFGGFGASREMTVAALTEGGLLFSLLAVALATGTTNFGDMILRLQELPFTQYLPIVLAFVSFVIALIAETGRIPVDNPATHLELTMIHEAMILEYSGKRLALMEWASANKLFIFMTLGANVFFPWGVATQLDFGSLLGALGLLVIKLLACGIGVAVLESTIAKLRFFRLPDLLFTSLVLGVIAVVIIVI